MKFNSNFYQPVKEYTKEMADAKMREKGYEYFTFKQASYSHGATFYFELENGDCIRVSDHRATGNRPSNQTTILFVEPKLMSINKK